MHHVVSADCGVLQTVVFYIDNTVSCILHRQYCVIISSKECVKERASGLTQPIADAPQCLRFLHCWRDQPSATLTKSYGVFLPAQPTLSFSGCVVCYAQLGHQQINSPWKGLHVGPNNFCYVTRQGTSRFIVSLYPHVTFYKTLTSLSTVFIKGHVGFLQLLKWPCRTSFFLPMWSPMK